MEVERPAQVAPELTAEQRQIAGVLLDTLGLKQFARAEIEMLGERGTLEYGLGRCARHFEDWPVEKIGAVVRATLRDQGVMEP
jgi:hypothetical protein